MPNNVSAYKTYSSPLHFEGLLFIPGLEPDIQPKEKHIWCRNFEPIKKLKRTLAQKPNNILMLPKLIDVAKVHSYWRVEGLLRWIKKEKLFHLNLIFGAQLFYSGINYFLARATG